MSGKRPEKKGSFGGHIDDLVKHFEHEPGDTPRRSARDERDLKDGHDIHDRLFASAWRKAREELHVKILPVAKQWGGGSAER